ncbi:MAG: nitroreductase family protein [Eubacteriales bacterium]|nr:nitroreductase family protein [Clostridiales bacterium]MDD7774824.1 nitroreductase family protein [Eubacteriales bacterium]MDY3940751.1 nitroreductase family protein [Eubacteriales bacterium]
MELRDLLIDNRSYRTFDESCEIPHDTILSWIDNCRICPSARNAQPLRYKIVDTREGVEKLLPYTAWAGALPDLKLPPDGGHPSAFVVILCDTTVTQDPRHAEKDVGIAAMTLLLSATEMGYGGCMIGAFHPDTVGEKLRIPERYVPMLIVALGKPAETVFITNPKADGDVTYFRDSHNLHFVPKRLLSDIVLE